MLNFFKGRKVKQLSRWELGFSFGFHCGNADIPANCGCFVSELLTGDVLSIIIQTKDVWLYRASSRMVTDAIGRLRAESTGLVDSFRLQYRFLKQTWLPRKWIHCFYMHHFQENSYSYLNVFDIQVGARPLRDPKFLKV